MKLSLTDNSQGYNISAYGEGFFTVRDKNFQGSHLFFSDSEPVQWPVAAFELLTSEHLEINKLNQYDLLIIGTGSRLQFPDDECLQRLYELQVGFEIMDTAAACRTYNIIVSEGRSAIAALIAI